MNIDLLKEEWLKEESVAHVHGWDFSHIRGRYEEEKALPWDYKEIIKGYLKPEHRLLDIDTGGGEFLLSLGHPYENTAATESFPPNVELCRQVLSPLGINFRCADGCEVLPFENNTFDIVINRHGEFIPSEIYRILKPGGIFITQQVGGMNDRELVELLLPGTPLPFPDWYLEKVSQQLISAGFEIAKCAEDYGAIKFYDMGALVWFARIIEWEFPEFSVTKCMPGLLKAQELLERCGCIEGRTHRFLIVATKSN